MSYVLKAGIGAALLLGSVALFNVKLLELLEVGTCASGGPYVTALPCPEGTGADMLLMVASVFGGLIGAAIFAFRGTPPWSPRRSGVSTATSGGLLAWTIFFAGTGLVVGYAGLFDDSLPDDSELGALIVAGTFLFLGLPVAAYLVWSWVSDLRDRHGEPGDRFAPSSPQTAVHPAGAAALPSRPTGGEWITTPGASIGSPVPPPPPAAPDAEYDLLTKLERLQRLRESGALTEPEFEEQKRRVLGG